MPESRTKLYHTCPTERPFDCITGDLTGEGFLVVVDTRTHELIVEEQTDETVTLAVNPIGVRVKRPKPRPGTRMLDLDASSSDPMRQAGESIERLRKFFAARRGQITYPRREES